MDFFNRFKKRIYLDYAAATALDPKVARLMRPWEGANFANPSSIHKEGVKARQAIDAARQKVATTLGVRRDGVLFTGSGTEANNLAILGYIKNLSRVGGVAYRDMEVVTTKLEHPSVLEVMSVLEATGVTVRYVEVNDVGQIKESSLLSALSPKTVMVSFAYANSEIGVVQPVLRLSRLIREFGKKHSTKIAIHLDAAQAPLWLPCEPIRLGVDLMTLDAGKCHGPKGVGVLVIKGQAQLLPIMYGGGQEQGLRPGTENVAGIVGTAEAIAIAQANHQALSKKVTAVRNAAIELLLSTLPEATLNGPVGIDRLANNINISIPGFDTEYAVIYLDTHKVAASTKSACAGSGSGESTVVKAISGDARKASSTIRFSLGPKTKVSDMKRVAQVLLRFCAKMAPLTK